MLMRGLEEIKYKTNTTLDAQVNSFVWINTNLQTKIVRK